MVDMIHKHGDIGWTRICLVINKCAYGPKLTWFLTLDISVIDIYIRLRDKYVMMS